MLKSIAAGAPRVPNIIKTFSDVRGDEFMGKLCLAKPSLHGTTQPQAATLYLSPPGSWLQISSPGLHIITHRVFYSYLHILPSASLPTRAPSPCSAEVSCPMHIHPPPCLPLSHQQSLVLWPAEPSGRKESYHGPHPWATACQGSSGEESYTVFRGSFRSFLLRTFAFSCQSPRAT